MKWLQQTDNLYTIFLIPPSEWKNKWEVESFEKLTYQFKKPVDIGKNAKEKDLKWILPVGSV